MWVWICQENEVGSNVKGHGYENMILTMLHSTVQMFTWVVSLISQLVILKEWTAQSK